MKDFPIFIDFLCHQNFKWFKGQTHAQKFEECMQDISLQTLIIMGPFLIL